MTLSAVLDQLVAAGLVEDRDAVEASWKAWHAEQLPTPWYVRAAVAIGAWITAFIVLTWLTCGLACANGFDDDGWVVTGLSALLGTASVVVGTAAAWVPRLMEAARERRGQVDSGLPPLVGRIALDFVEQAALVGVLAGQLGFGAGLFMLTDAEELVAVLMILQSALLLLYPHPVQRFASALLVGCWTLALVYMAELEFLRDVVALTACAIASVWWLLRPLLARTPAEPAHAPIGLGLMTVALGMPLVPWIEEDFLGTPPLAIGLGLLAVGLTLGLLIEARARPLAWLGLLVVAALATVSWVAPGWNMALVALAMGVRARSLPLQLLGAAGMLWWGATYWVQLDTDVGPKSAALVLTGIVFAVAHLVVRRLR